MLNFFSPALAEAKTFKQSVLILYNSLDGDYNSTNNIVASTVETFLNHLGMVVDYHDINTPLPDEQQMTRYRGIISCFYSSSLKTPLKYLDWAERQLDAGRRFIILGNLGAFEDINTGEKIPLARINRFLEKIGVTYEQSYVNDPTRIELVFKDSAMMEFERTLDYEYDLYEKLRPVKNSLQSYLTLKLRNKPQSESYMVAISDTGGYVWGMNYLCYSLPSSKVRKVVAVGKRAKSPPSLASSLKIAEERKHIVSPPPAVPIIEMAPEKEKKVLEKKMGGVKKSAPEELEINISTNKKTPAESTTKKILLHRNWYQYRLNPYLFFEKALDLKGKPRLDTTTICGRRIYYSHIDGDGFSNRPFFDPDKFSAEIIRDRIIIPYSDFPIGVSFIAGEIEFNSEPQRAKDIARSIFKLKNVEPASHTYSHPLSWKEGKQAPSTIAYSLDSIRFSLRSEIVGSIDYLNRTLLVGLGKKVVTLYWSGDCDPPEEAFKILAENNLLAINGGDTRKDRDFSSYTSVCPLTALKGKYRQIYSSNSNENTYTNLWKGPFFSFKHVQITWKETDSPYRLQPINHYYHFYSGERLPSLNALISNMEYVSSIPVNPIFPSRFIRIVQDFHTASIEELEEGGYAFSNLGECRTVRFDDIDLVPDLIRSKGVMGYTTHNRSLYLALDPEVTRPEVRFSSNVKNPFYLVEAGCRIGSFKRTGARVSFWAEGFGNPTLHFHVPKDGIYKITAHPPQGRSHTFEVKSLNRRLSFNLELNQRRLQLIVKL